MIGGGDPLSTNQLSEQINSNGVETALLLTQTNNSSGEVA